MGRASEPDTPLHVKLLLAIREQRQWSQRELVAYLGVSRRTVMRWELQQAHPHWMWMSVFRQVLEEGV